MFGRQKKQAEPESESDWDTNSEAVTTKGKKSAAAKPLSFGDWDSDEEHPVKDSTNQKAKKGGSVPSSKKTTPTHKPSPQAGGRQATLNFDFDDDDDDDSWGDKKKRKQSVNPPYDFTPALRDTDRSPQQDRKRPGKERKGVIYDPQGAGTASWDDSDAEERTLAQLRANFDKGKRRTSSASSTPNLASKSKQAPNASNGTPHKTKHKPAEKDKNKTGQKGIQESPQSHNKSDAKPQLQKQKAVKREQEVKLNMSQSEDEEETKDQGEEVLKETGHQSNDVPEKNRRMSKFILPAKHPPADNLVYYFEEGEKEYITSTRPTGKASLPLIADKAELLVQRVWREVFAGLRIVMSVFILLLLEMVTCLLRHIVQQLFIGLLLLIGDYVLKPLLSALYNGFLQPVLVFVWNINSGVRNASGPLLDITQRLAEQVALVLRAFRLVEWNTAASHHSKESQQI